MMLFSVQRPYTLKPFDGEYETTLHLRRPRAIDQKPSNLTTFLRIHLERALNEVSFSQMHTRLNI